jgi:CubicO group peptidase (beta-lactamase class C family)
MVHRTSGRRISALHAGLVYLVIVLASCDPRAATSPLGADQIERIDSLARAVMRERSVPGLSIAIASRGELLLARGWGTANGSDPVTDKTVFDLGSIKKQITAAAVLRLVDRGAIDLNDPVEKWVQSIHVPGTPVRIRQMLEQVSGLPDVEDDTIRTLDFAPGSRWEYSNANFDRMDAVIEAVDGRPFPVFLDEELAGPLHLASLSMCDEAQPPPVDMAQGYTRREGAMTTAEDPCWFRGTTVDLALWIDALFGGNVVSPRSLAQMTTPARLSDGTETEYGFGVLLRPFAGQRRFSHTGHVAGFTSAFGYYPDRAATIAVAGNSDTLFDPDAIEVTIARILFDLPTSQRPAFRRGDAHVFAGEFDAGSVRFRVEAKGADSLTLVMLSPDDPPHEYLSTDLVRIGPDAFVGADSPDVVSARFVRDPGDDRPTIALIDVVGLPWKAVRR